MPIALCAQQDWQLAKSKNGINVYTKYYKSHGLKQLRVESTFTGVNLHTMFAIFKDLDSTHIWTAKLNHAKSLKEYSQTDYINYFLINIPWPLRNRDAIFKVHASFNKQDHSLQIESKAFPEFAAENDTCVRVREAHAVWRFTQIDSGIKVQSSLYADPRGFPGWLVNLFVTDAPYETMYRLRQFSKKNKYKNAKFDFISD